MIDSHFMVEELRNIIKTDDGFKLQQAYDYSDKGGVVELEQSKKLGKELKQCDRCIHSTYWGDGKFSCDINDKLRNAKHLVIYNTNVYKCQANHNIAKLIIIKSEKEMVDLISIVANLFGCIEDYEAYFGFERRWNEDTGEVLETVHEYYERGGQFTEIPSKYPSIIYFDEDKEKLEWIDYE